MNQTSSRSHAIFTIYLEIVHNENVRRKSVINLVDLAGSEGLRKTGNTGEAQAEGKCINESLSAFKRVISAMSCGARHIPFRDSLITKILTGMSNAKVISFLISSVYCTLNRFAESQLLPDIIGLRQSVRERLWRDVVNVELRR